MKAPIRWYIYWQATKVRDWNIPVIEQIADFIRDKTWVYDDHKD
jgi:hypothetical protein